MSCSISVAVLILVACLLQFLVAKSITAIEGDSVILPCQFKPLGNNTLIWKYCNKRNVLKVKGDKVVEQVHNRVKTFMKEHVTGNLSIKISNVTVDDSECYECHLQPDGFEKTVTLNVTERRKTDEKSPVTPGGGAVTLQLSAFTLAMVMCFLFM